MSIEENKAIVRRFIEEGWHNIDILDEVLADKIVFTGGKVVSLEDLKQRFSWLNTGFPDARTVIVWILAKEDSVVAGWKCEATHTKEWEGILPTHRRATWIGCTKVRIVDGRIVEWWQLWDRFAAMAQLGYIPPFDEMIKQAQSKQA
jgi:predicted ester cyclase